MPHKQNTTQILCAIGKKTFSNNQVVDVVYFQIFNTINASNHCHWFPIQISDKHQKSLSEHFLSTITDVQEF